MGRIFLLNHVDTAFVLEIPTIVDLSGKHLLNPTILEGEIIARFGDATAINNKHGAAPGANQFRTDITDGKLQCTFVAADTVHHHLWVRGTDDDSQWLNFQYTYQLQFNQSRFDGNYIRYLRGDGVTVVAHRVVQLTGGVTIVGPVIDGDVP